MSFCPRRSPWSSPAASSRGPDHLSFGRCLRGVGCSASATLPRAASKISVSMRCECGTVELLLFQRGDYNAGRESLQAQKNSNGPSVRTNYSVHVRSQPMHFVSVFRPFLRTQVDRLLLSLLLRSPFGEKWPGTIPPFILKLCRITASPTCHCHGHCFVGLLPCS